MTIVWVLKLVLGKWQLSQDNQIIHGLWLWLVWVLKWVWGKWKLSQDNQIIHGLWLWLVWFLKWAWGGAGGGSGRPGPRPWGGAGYPHRPAIGTKMQASHFCGTTVSAKSIRRHENGKSCRQARSPPSSTSPSSSAPPCTNSLKRKVVEGTLGRHTRARGQ